MFYRAKRAKPKKLDIFTKSIAFALAGFLVAIPFTAHAADGGTGSLSVINLSYMSNYNLIVFDNLSITGNGDTMGPVAIGKSASINGDFPFNTGGDDKDIGLVFGYNKAKNIKGKLTSSGNGSVKGKVVAVQDKFEYSSYIKSSQIEFKTEEDFNKIFNFDSVKSDLLAKSKAISELDPTMNTQISRNGAGGLVLKCADGAKLNVFKIEKAEDLAALSDKEIHIENIKPDTTIIINVPNDAVAAFGNGQLFLNNKASQDTSEELTIIKRHIIWNFYEATTLTKTGSMSIAGSILAPKATFNIPFGGSGNFEGTIAVNNYHDCIGFEGHMFTFNGEITVPTTSTPSTPVSTPSTPVSTPSTPVSTPSTPVSTPSTPVSTPSTPVSTPSTPVSTPSTPVSTPSTPVSTPSTSSVPSTPGSSSNASSEVISDYSTPLVSAPSSAVSTTISDNSVPQAGPSTGDNGNYIILAVSAAVAFAAAFAAFKLRKKTNKQ